MEFLKVRDKQPINRTGQDGGLAKFIAKEPTVEGFLEARGEQPTTQPKRRDQAIVFMSQIIVISSFTLVYIILIGKGALDFIEDRFI